MPRRLPALVCLIALYTAVLAFAPRPLVVAQNRAGITTRISVSSDGTQGNEFSADPVLSGDGRYVVFISLASNLVAGDTNGVKDAFVHDRQTGLTSRVSVNSSGAQSNGEAAFLAMSADGRYVAFESSGSDLVAGDTNGFKDVFVYDRQTGLNSRVSVSSDGAQGNFDSRYPNLSADGRFIVFFSLSSTLVAGDTNGFTDVFVHDRQTGVTSRVSVSSEGVQANYGSSNAVISADGRYVAFESMAYNLVTSDNDLLSDIFIHDRQTGVTSLVSVRSDGTKGNRSSHFPSLSGDGRYVAFDSEATNLVDDDINGCYDVFLHDQQTGLTTRISVAPDGSEANGDSVNPVLSADGGYVAFTSLASNLIAGDTNHRHDIFVRDLQAGATTRITVSSDGTQANHYSEYPAISSNGRYVAFQSFASNLVTGDTNNKYDVFIHDRQVPLLTPVITGFDPIAGLVGTAVTITGTNFTGATALTFNGTNQPAFTLNPDGTQIIAAVPDGATTGQIAVTAPDGTAASATNFTVILAPSLTGFSPTAGPIGTPVTISGADLAWATAVAFNGTSQPDFTIDPSGTQITASVPAGATTGKITVTTPGGAAESANDFTVLPAPTITSFSPTSGPVGTSVTINGADFTGATSVKFNGISQPTFTVNSATKITAAVPTGATTGKISVTTPNGTATSATDFTITSPPAIYLSPTGSGKVGPATATRAFTNADILSYVRATNTWDVLYDGSTIKTTKNLGAFAFVGNDILLGFSAAQVVPGLGATAVPPQDLVRFTPTSTGYNNTAGTFAWFFDGSDVGLTTAAEAIDALWIDAQGRLYISTAGTGEVPANSANPTGAKVKFQDEDVLRFTPSSTGATTAGTWTLYWDPTLMTGMSAEDINGYWEDPATGARYVTILGAFNIGNTAYGGKFAGNGKTILRFAPNGAAPGGWAPAENVTWLAAGAAFPSNIDAIEMAR